MTPSIAFGEWSVPCQKSVIAIQTVYFISSAGKKFCSRMVMLLNSTPVRTFIKSFSERARGGYYRHISWVVGLVPIPQSFERLPASLKREKIDNVISKTYGLSSEETKAIEGYNDFLEGER